MPRDWVRSARSSPPKQLSPANKFLPLLTWTGTSGNVQKLRDIEAFIGLVGRDSSAVGQWVHFFWALHDRAVSDSEMVNVDFGDTRRIWGPIASHQFADNADAVRGVRARWPRITIGEEDRFDLLAWSPVTNVNLSVTAIYWYNATKDSA